MRLLAAGCWLLATATTVAAQQGRGPELLSAARIDSLPAAQREAWTRYVARSRELEAADRVFMAAELKAAGLERMRRATYARGFQFDADTATEAWLRSDAARRLAESLLTWQTPAGGWSKRTEMSRPRQRGESWYAESDAWHYIGTIDNGATVAQLRFLSRVADATGEERFREAVGRGVDYLLAAQMPNGCWPQAFPLQGEYSDAVTFNDDANVNVLELLREVEASSSIPSAQRARAAEARRRAHECLLAAQVVVNGTRTVWGQQHDPLTLAVTKARSYELAGLSGRESAAIMTYFMTLPDPDARVVAAVDAAAAYFERTKIFGYEYHFERGLREQAGAGPIWARLREIGSDRPIFANRDGVVLYDWNQLTDRRSGYAWYGTEPGSALAKYAKWQRARAKASPRVTKGETTGGTP